MIRRLFRRGKRDESESLASLLLGGAVLVLWFVLLFVLLPVLAT